MAIQKIKEGKFFNVYHQTFLIDDDTDLDILEQTYNCNLGDEAKLPDGTIYVRHSNDYQGDKWVVKSSGSNGSGGGGGSDLPITPSTDGTYALTNTVSSGTGTLSWGSGGGDVIIVNDVDGTLDKTWQEIFDLLTQGKQIVSIYAEDGYVTQYPLLHAKYTVGDENPYSVLGFSCDNPPSVGYVTYTADSADSYPEYQDS